MNRLSSQSQDSIQRIIKVINGTVEPNPGITVLQFSMVLHALSNDGLTGRELAQLCECDESAVSRAFKGLGPEGTGCLQRVDGKIRADQHVIDAFNLIHS